MKAAFYPAVRTGIAWQRNPHQQAQKANHDQALKTAGLRRDWERLGNNGIKVGGCVCVVMPGAGVTIIVASLIIREVGKIYNALKQNSIVTRNQEQASALQAAV